MSKQGFYSIVLLVMFNLTWTSIYAQEEEEQSIETERVIIVKAYTPEISDAFKIKATPVIADSITQQKKPIRYSIFSVPVASTFTPAKGRAASLDRPKKIDLFDNYATLGFGNFTSVLAEFYSDFQLSRTDHLGVYLHHNSSQGGIEEVRLDNKYYNTDLNLNYTSRNKEYTYGIEVGAEHQLFNWYGLPSNPVLTDAELNAVDAAQNYFGAKIGGKLVFDDLYFKKAKLQYRLFGDQRGSLEHHVATNANFEFEVGDEKVDTQFIIDYLGGSFDGGLDIQTTIPYQIINLGVQPSLKILRDDLTVNLGAALYYSINTEINDNDLYIYPKVTASLRLLEESVIAYGGLEGGLQQNTYRDAVQQNPFVAPGLGLTPTHNPYEGYLGLKGKIAEVVSYNFRAGYSAENDKQLFVNNRPAAVQADGFDFGNSFSYSYDDIKTVKGYGELNFHVNKQFKLGTSVSYFSYTMENEQEAWNLPELEATAHLDYQISKQWYAGAQVFYVGERKDIDNTTPLGAVTPEATITLDSYIDVNLNIGYRVNDQLSFFVKGNNLLGNSYQTWANYPVQGLQLLGGATYKFNY